MDYLTNYYKNQCEVLQSKFNKLQMIIESIAIQPTLFGEPEALGAEDTNYSPQTIIPGGHPSNNQGGGDGLRPGWEKPFEKGWNSDEWKKWISTPPNYHKTNPHKFGTPAFYKWEWEYYEQPPGP